MPDSGSGLPEMSGVLISLGLGLLGQVISHFTKAKLPQQLIDGLQAAYNAIEQHAQDTMTKAEWESLRG